MHCKFFEVFFYSSLQNVFQIFKSFDRSPGTNLELHIVLVAAKKIGV